MVTMVMLAISVVVIMVIAVAIMISVPLPIPMVVVLYPPAITFPIARKELFAVVMRLYPSGPFIGGQGPVPFVPTVMPANRIPISADPRVPGPGT